jgi:hypothetical protein
VREHAPDTRPSAPVLPMGLVALTAMAIEDASAHDKGCDVNPVLCRIKLDCCGEAEEYQLRPEQIRRGPNDEYIASFEGYTFVIPADKALPSNDPCSPYLLPKHLGGDRRRRSVARFEDAEHPLLPHTAGLLTT